ncbi:energy-converting hydrogenase A subunit H [Methanomicrobium sp. W14]|uniref:hypothetical protein n=1 Tax=Methanomicrobium sp. W14 TaxID=2817839 RepID=UPI001AE89626|nr:hypothetical protein [Methanomicrobium sp. W14]MBP2132342.1 energy-converting hydrogenase A subunit H [Methanomicrobium sp. W14]
MYELVNTNIEGQALFSIPFGDIVDYLTPYTAILFTFALVFTVIAIISKPERQVDIAFGGDAYYTKDISKKQMRFQRFMATACGLATMGGVLSGDVFNFTLFTAMVGIANIGIVASVKNKHILDNAFEYGILAMVGTMPLFGGAAIVLASTGTLSMWILFTPVVAVPLVAKLLLVIGVLAEGMAPVYVAKAEITRAPGAPYILMVHVSSLVMFLRVIEIVVSM